MQNFNLCKLFLIFNLLSYSLNSMAPDDTIYPFAEDQILEILKEKIDLIMNKYFSNIDTKLSKKYKNKLMRQLTNNQDILKDKEGKNLANILDYCILNICQIKLNLIDHLSLTKDTFYKKIEEKQDHNFDPNKVMYNQLIDEEIVQILESLIEKNPSSEDLPKYLDQHLSQFKEKEEKKIKKEIKHIEKKEKKEILIESITNDLINFLENAVKEKNIFIIDINNKIKKEILQELYNEKFSQIFQNTSIDLIKEKIVKIYENQIPELVKKEFKNHAKNKNDNIKDHILEIVKELIAEEIIQELKKTINFINDDLLKNIIDKEKESLKIFLIQMLESELVTINLSEKRINYEKNKIIKSLEQSLTKKFSDFEKKIQKLYSESAEVCFQHLQDLLKKDDTSKSYIQFIEEKLTDIRKIKKTDPEQQYFDKFNEKKYSEKSENEYKPKTRHIQNTFKEKEEKHRKM